MRVLNLNYFFARKKPKLIPKAVTFSHTRLKLAFFKSRGRYNVTVDSTPFMKGSSKPMKRFSVPRIPQHAMSATNSRTGVIPASLSFFAIYNPSLSSNDESLQDQLVYYYSNNEKEGKSKATGGDIQSEQAREAVNERLRQIGLAQGMVEFAKCFFLSGVGSTP